MLGLLLLTTSCNDEWEDEQYAHYVAFSAPLDNDGVRVVNVPYTRCLYDNDGNAYLLYEHSDEPDDALHGIRYDFHEYRKCTTYRRSHQ